MRREGHVRVGQERQNELAEPLPLVYADEYMPASPASRASSPERTSRSSPGTDVIVSGSAFALGGKAVTQMTVKVRQRACRLRCS